MRNYYKKTDSCSPYHCALCGKAPTPWYIYGQDICEECKTEENKKILLANLFRAYKKHGEGSVEIIK